METTIDQQVALDETLVPSTQRLRIGRRNFRLPSDIQSKESTLQVVYDVLRNSPFFRAFLVTADVPKIYMQEFWATTKLHQHSIHFKMDTRKSEYYACATREAAPKPKASARKKKGDSASSTTPPTPTPTTTVVATPRLSATAKDEGTGSRPGVSDVPSDDSEEELSWNSSDDEDVDEQTKGREESEGDKTDESYDGSDVGNNDDNDETVKAGSERDEDDDDNDDEEELAKKNDEDTESSKGGDEISKSERESDEEETRKEEEESFDPIPKTPEGSEDESNDEEDQDLRLSEEARIQEEEEADELGGIHFHTASSLIVSLQPPTPIMTHSTIATITTSSDAPIPPTTIPSIILKNLPTFNSAFRFDERLRSLETTSSEYRQTNSFVDAVSVIPENDEFIRNIDENMKKIIKGQVKSQVKEQVSHILPRIEESMNATLEAEVLTRSSHSLRTSYAIAADLSEMELKKILIEKMEGNKSIQRSNEQRTLYKALVEAYDADKAILDTYRESTILKRRREDDDQEGPSAGSDCGSKRRREGGEHASASTPSETATRSAGRSTTGSQSRQLSASESAFAEKPVQTTCQMEEPSHPVFETGADDQLIIQTSQHPKWFSQPRRPPSPDHFSNFIMNRLDVATLTHELLAGPTYKLMRGSCNSLTKLEFHLEKFYKATTDQLDWVNPEGHQTPKESEEESNDEEDQDLRLSKEAKIQEEEDADELYRDVNINQGRGLQVTQNVEDTHVTLTLVNPDGPQEISSMSSFVSSMLNPISDVGVESIFTTASSPIVSLQTPTPIMTPSTIATITTSSKAPIPPPTIPSIILKNLPTFNSAFRFEESLRSLETSFSVYRQTNQFADAMSAIPEEPVQTTCQMEEPPHPVFET
nr:hypothetical protein [Tanacetum cinerariifolium]